MRCLSPFARDFAALGENRLEPTRQIGDKITELPADPGLCDKRPAMKVHICPYSYMVNYTGDLF